MGIFDFLKPKSRIETILQKYYRGYARKPYISPDRDFDKWEEMISISPTMLVQREMMVPFEDGLLPGHAYMLFWIDKIHRSRIPAYFEYEYGINFEEEKEFLQRSGYLDGNNVTEKGQQAIQDHYEVIRQRNPEPASTGTVSINNESQIIRVIPERQSDSVENIPRSEYDQLKSELSYLNEKIDLICKKFKLPKMFINFRYLTFGTGQFETHYIYTPKTKTQKASKYPLCVRYSYKEINMETPAVFGEIFYLQNGKIGKTWQVYWIGKEGYVIEFGQTKNELVLKRIEHSIPATGSRVFIFKESK